MDRQSHRHPRKGQACPQGARYCLICLPHYTRLRPCAFLKCRMSCQKPEAHSPTALLESEGRIALRQRALDCAPCCADRRSRLPRPQLPQPAYRRSDIEGIKRPCVILGAGALDAPVTPLLINPETGAIQSPASGDGVTGAPVRIWRLPFWCLGTASESVDSLPGATAQT